MTLTKTLGTTSSGSGTTPIAPSAIANLYRWFKSDTGVTMNGSNQVSNWADQSGLGGDASQATVGNMPVYTTSVLDGYPGLRFTRANSQKLDLSLASLVSSEYTIMMVTGRRSSTTPQYCLGAITSGTANASLHNGWRSGSTWTLGQWSNDLDLTVEAFVLGRYHAMFSLLNAGFGHKVETFDGTTNTNNANTTTLGSIPGGGTIGMAVGSYWDGDIVEIAIWTAALTKAQRDGVRAYLNAKYPSALTTW